MALEVLRRPSVAGEGMGVLGTDDQHRVRIQGKCLLFQRLAIDHPSDPASAFAVRLA